MSASAGKKSGMNTAEGSKAKVEATAKKPSKGEAAAAKPAKGGEKAPSAAAPRAGSSAGGASDVQRKMREALEAKQAKSRSAHGEDHLGGHGVGASSNDVTKRQFRRKSGG